MSALLLIVLCIGGLAVTAGAEDVTQLPSPAVTVRNVTGSGRILVTWDPVEDALSYKVYRAASKSGSFSSIGSTGANKLTDTSAISGKTYYYKVKAIAEDSDANSPFSSVESGTYKLPQPEIELDTTGAGKVKISWKAVSGAQSYDLYRSTDGENWKMIKNVTGTDYTNSSVETGITYYYRLQAVASKEAANSALSEAKSIIGPLAAPAISLKNDSDTGKIIVSWASVEGATGYEIYRSSSKSGTYKQIGSSDSDSFTDASAVGGKTYFYKVSAYDGDSGARSAKSSAASATCALARPTVEAKNNSTGKIVLTWDKQEGAASYKVYRATSKTGEFKLVKTTTSRKFTDTSVSAGKVYYYKVKALAEDSDANSAYSEIVSQACKLAQPSVTLSNVAKTGEIKISWKAVSGAKSYDLYSSTDMENWTPIKNTTDTSYTDSAVTPGVMYYYKVQAIASKSAANSEFSEIEAGTCKLARPTVTLKNNSTTGKILVSWTAVEGAQSYEVYRASSKTGDYKLVDTVTGTTLTDDSGSAGKTYYYKVRALGENTEASSAYSKVVSATRKLARPEVTLKNVSSNGKIIVSWESQKGARTYEVYRATSKTGSFSKIKTTTSTSFTDTSSAAGKTYYYKVRALGSISAANSAYSEAASGICKLSRPSVTLKNSDSSGQVVLSWSKVTGAQSYEVYRADSKNGDYVYLKSTESTKTIDSAGELGVTYYYKVRAIAEKAAANSALSSADSGMRKLECPVITLTNDPSTGKIVISWEGIEDARMYDIYRATSKNGDYKLVKTSYFTQITDTSAGAGKTYYYKVRSACDNKDVTSAFSGVESAVCKLARAKVTVSNNESTGKITVSWGAVKKVRAYSVYRAASADGEFKLVKTTSATSYTDTSSTAGKTYYYKVRALADSSAANAAYSKVESGTGKLVQPTIKLGEVSDAGTFKITWSAVTGARSYDLYRSTDMENWTLLQSTTGRSHTTRIPEDGVTYYFRLQAVASREAANSAFSDVKNVYSKLLPPVITVSQDEALGRAKVSWDAVEHAVSYAVYRSSSKTGSYTKLGTTDKLSYIDPTGKAGRTYYYKVKAVAFNSDANSVYSDPASGSSKYVEDMNLSIELNKNGKPYLTWGQLKNIKEYRIYRSTTENKGFEKISETETFSYTNTSVAEGVTYYYKIKAVDDSGKVAQISETLSVTPSLSQEETLRTRYVAVPKVKLHTMPDSTSPEIPLRYMDKVQLGNAVITRESGTWYRVFYEGDLYYLLIKTGDKDLTATKSTFTYTANTKFQQRLLNEAMDLAFNQKTFYQEGGSGDLNAGGAMGFDCSGMVSYLLNQTMRKWVPVYTVSSSMSVLSATKDLYNIGYTGAFSAHKITRVEDLQPGDVLFFRSQLDSEISSELGHCAIYLGNNEFIHCTSVWDDSVCIMPLTGDFESNLLEIRRFLPETVTSARESVRVSSACKVYERRNDESPVLQSLKENAKVTILYINDRWAYVKTPAGNKGFVKAEYIP